MIVKLSSLNYYPFGMVTPGRSFAAGDGYRFGFNGKESDAETYGSGNIYDYGFRIYNPRLGKFLSVDPLNNKYAFYTPYSFASNYPTSAIDVDGLETPVLYNNTEIVAASTQTSYMSPNGGTLTVPSISNVTQYCSEYIYTINNQEVKVADGSVSGFEYNGKVYTAYFNIADGMFYGYMNEDGNLLNTDVNTLPEWELSGTLSLGTVWVTSGRIALSDGPEPGPMDVVGLGVGVLGTALIYVMMHDFREDVSIINPEVPFGGYNVYTESNPDIESIDDKKWLEEHIGDIEEFKDEYFPGQGGEFDVKRNKNTGELILESKNKKIQEPTGVFIEK